MRGAGCEVGVGGVGVDGCVDVGIGVGGDGGGRWWLW